MAKKKLKETAEKKRRLGISQEGTETGDIEERGGLGRNRQGPVADERNASAETELERLSRGDEAEEPSVHEEREETDEERKERVVEQYAADVTDPENPLYHRDIMTWYVRNQIKASHLTPAEIAERSGVAVSQIYRFLKGERSLTLESVDKLMPIIGRSLVESVRRHQERSPDVEIEAEKERLRAHIDEWHDKTFSDVKEILKDVGRLADRIRYLIDEL